MKIFALYGKGNTGKSSTIREIYEQIKSKSKVIKEEYYKNGVDVTAIISIKNLTIGITSYGDDAKCINAPFELFKNGNCDVIICASRVRRTKTGSVVYLKNFEKNNKASLIWIKKEYFEIDEDNNKTKETYKEIIEKINSIQVERVLNQIKINCNVNLLN